MYVLKQGHLKNTCLDHALDLKCHMFNDIVIRTALPRDIKQGMRFLSIFFSKFLNYLNFFLLQY